MRTIDADADKCRPYLYEYLTDAGMIAAQDAINAMPTVDAVPVTRCEYCYAYRKDRELARAANLDEEQYCALLQCEMPEYGYCYYGSQKGTKGENGALN